MSDEKSNILIHRRYSDGDEAYKYTHIASGMSDVQAKGKATRVRCEPDDLLIICDERDVYEFADKAKFIYMADDTRKPRALPEIHYQLKKYYKTWLEAWEGSNSKADDMMLAAYHSLGVTEIVSTLCEIARSVLIYIDPSESRPRLAIETVKAWTIGEATLDDVANARYGVRSFFNEIYQPLGVSRTQEAVSSVMSLVSILAMPSVGSGTEWALINNTVTRAARASLRPDQESLHHLASIVRSAIPLEKIIKAYRS